MAGEDRYSHACTADPQVRDGQDLAALVAELLLFVGLERSVVDVLAGVGQHVEGDRLGELARCRKRHCSPVVRELAGPVDHFARLLVELIDARQPRAADSLVGGGDQPNQTGLVVQRLEDRHRSHRRAVGVGDDALAGVGDLAGVHLADDQRHVGIHPPRRRVVDDSCSRSGKLRCKLTGRHRAR